MVNGTNFVSGAVVTWNGNSRTTTFVSSTQLSTTILAIDIAAVGTVTVNVVNPAPNSLQSDGMTFAINAPPPPTITLLSPTKAVAGGLGVHFDRDWNELRERRGCGLECQ